MILVVGGTGSLGGRIVRGLRERGYEVRVLVRPGSDRSALERIGASIVTGDLRDRASLERACEGIATVVSTASATRRTDDTVENVDLRGHENLVDAARAAGVGHLMFVSAVGAAAEHPEPVYRAKGLVERRIRESGIGYTILQPNAFMDVWFPVLVELPVLNGQAVTLVGEARRRHSFVVEQDVAAFALAALGHPDARDATIVIGGPEAISFRDVVRAYEEVLGRPLEIRSVPPGEPIPGVPEPVWGLAAALDSFDSVIPMEETAARFGVRLTSVQEFARARTAALSAAGL